MEKILSYQNPTFGTVTSKTNIEDNSAEKVLVQNSLGKLNWIYKNSLIPDSFTKVVYVNNNNPNEATIFDLNNPPVTNDNLLKSDVNNLYIGTDASTWVYNATTVNYVTKTVTSNTSNFHLAGTTTDAGNNKTAAIERTGPVGVGTAIASNHAVTKAQHDTKANTLTDINFGAFINGLTPKITPIDADSISIVDSADSNKQKKVSLTIFKVFLKTFFDGIYQDILASGTNIKTVNGNSLLGSGNLSVIASPYNIRCFYQSWNASALNTWRSWNRNTSNILVADANQSLGTGTTPGSFVDSNFLMINGQNSLTKLTLSIKNSGSATSVNFEICVQKFDLVNGTQSGMELNNVILIKETFTTSATSLITLKDNFTISSHSLSANSGLFVAYRQTTGTVSPIQGVSLVFEFN